jgi:hypothetical protein
MSANVVGDPFALCHSPLKVPNLLSLSIEHYESTNDEFPWLSSATQLKDAFLWESVSLAPNSLQSLSSSHLHVITTIDHTIGQSLQVMRPHATHLKQLIVHLTTGNSGIDDIVTLVGLEGLYLECYPEDLFGWEDPMASLLDHLNASSLTTLHLRDMYQQGLPRRSWSQSSFDGFVARSGIAGHLKALIISSNFCSPEDVIQAVDLLPNLHLLSLSAWEKGAGGPHIMDLMSLPVLHHLTPTPTRRVLPKLQRLCFSFLTDGKDLLRARLAALATLVEVRCAPEGVVAQLEALQLRPESLVTDASTQESFRRLHSCRAHGLRLCIEYVLLDRASIKLTSRNGRLPEDRIALSFDARVRDSIKEGLYNFR